MQVYAELSWLAQARGSADAAVTIGDLAYYGWVGDSSHIQPTGLMQARALEFIQLADGFSGPFEGRFLGDYADVPRRHFTTLEEAVAYARVILRTRSAQIGGITLEGQAEGRQYTLRKGTVLHASPTAETSWLAPAGGYHGTISLNSISRLMLADAFCRSFECTGIFFHAVRDFLIRASDID